MSECLVPKKVRPELIDAIYVCDNSTQENIKTMLNDSKISIIPEPNLFFRPSFSKRIGENISLIGGDMFFSNM